MMNTLRHRLLNALQQAHRDERGAIVLLLLAAFLIVFMTALVVYDTGQSARDKMDAQIGADTAAFSQAAIKSRGMNMIAYANVAKRTFYAFSMMYSAAYLGMIAAASHYSSKCTPHPATWPMCLKALEGWAMVAVEAGEFVAKNRTTLGIFADAYAAAEVDYLDEYSKYMNGITPWWAWSEALTRGLRNGTTITGSWPPPPGEAAGINALWVKVNKYAEMFLGENMHALYPSAGAKDGLPIEKKEGGLQGIAAHGFLCASTAVSTEHLWMWGEHYVRSEGFAKDQQAILAGILATPLGCFAASSTLGDAVLPFEIADGASGSALDIGDGMTDPRWTQATSNIVLSYKMDPDRWSNEGDRQRYMYMSDEYLEETAIAKGGGYFALTRSEIVYSGGIISSAVGNLQGMLGNTGPVGAEFGGFLGALRDVFDQPNMWAARWTARMRPMQLPGEEEMPRFDAMVLDMLPYMILTTPIAYANSPSEFSLEGARGFGEAAIQDLGYLLAVSIGHGEVGGGFVQ